MGKMLKMQMLEDEDDLAYETEKKQRTSSSSDAQPAWMRILRTTASNWLQLIPESVNHLKRTVENIKVMQGIYVCLGLCRKPAEDWGRPEMVLQDKRKMSPLPIALNKQNTKHWVFLIDYCARNDE